MPKILPDSLYTDGFSPWLYNPERRQAIGAVGAIFVGLTAAACLPESRPQRIVPEKVVDSFPGLATLAQVRFPEGIPVYNHANLAQILSSGENVPLSSYLPDLVGFVADYEIRRNGLGVLDQGLKIFGERFPYGLQILVKEGLNGLYLDGYTTHGNPKEGTSNMIYLDSALSPDLALEAVAHELDHVAFGMGETRAYTASLHTFAYMVAHEPWMLPTMLEQRLNSLRIVAKMLQRTPKNSNAQVFFAQMFALHGLIGAEKIDGKTFDRVATQIQEKGPKFDGQVASELAQILDGQPNADFFDRVFQTTKKTVLEYILGLNPRATIPQEVFDL